MCLSMKNFLFFLFSILKVKLLFIFLCFFATSGNTVFAVELYPLKADEVVVFLEGGLGK